MAYFIWTLTSTSRLRSVKIFFFFFFKLNKIQTSHLTWRLFSNSRNFSIKIWIKKKKSSESRWRQNGAGMRRQVRLFSCILNRAHKEWTSMIIYRSMNRVNHIKTRAATKRKKRIQTLLLVPNVGEVIKTKKKAAAAVAAAADGASTNQN